MGTHPLNPSRSQARRNALSTARVLIDVLPGGPLSNPRKVIVAIGLSLNAVLLHRRPSPWGGREEIPRAGQLRLGDRRLELRHHHHFFRAVGLVLPPLDIGEVGEFVGSGSGAVECGPRLVTPAFSLISAPPIRVSRVLHFGQWS